MKIPNSLDALLISSSSNIAYLTGFFGFSTTEREGYLLLTKNKIYIFASGLNSEAVKKHIDQYSSSEKRNDESRSISSRQARTLKLIEISPRSPLTKKALAQIIKKEKIKKLGFEKHHLTFAEYERLHKDLRVKLVPTEHFVEEMRMIKTADEIASIEKACELGDKAFAYILTKIKPGISEKELAFELELFIRKAGADISFPFIVAFGPNSSIPHHVASSQKLEASSWVLLDFGVKIDEYSSDMTRTVFFGKASKEQKRMYQTVLESQQKAFNTLLSFRATEGSRGISYNPNTVKKDPSTRASHFVGMTSASVVDKAARDYIIKRGFPTIPHSLGHGIGLEVHEPPRLSIKSTNMLKPDMVFSIEPGIYLPGIGGIRIEDLVVLEKTGPRFLTRAKRELIEL